MQYGNIYGHLRLFYIKKELTSRETEIASYPDIGLDLTFTQMPLVRCGSMNTVQEYIILNAPLLSRNRDDERPSGKIRSNFKNS